MYLQLNMQQKIFPLTLGLVIHVNKQFPWDIEHNLPGKTHKIFLRFTAHYRTFRNVPLHYPWCYVLSIAIFIYKNAFIHSTAYTFVMGVNAEQELKSTLEFCKVSKQTIVHVAEVIAAVTVMHRIYWP